MRFGLNRRGEIGLVHERVHSNAKSTKAVSCPGRTQETYLSKIAGRLATSGTQMDKLDPVSPAPEEESADSDLARRLARYRRRVEAEGRPRSVRLIDRAIEDADKKTNSRQ